MRKPIVIFCCIVLFAVLCFNQNAVAINPDLQSRAWDARWITHPDIDGEEVGVYLFRKIFDLKTIPEEFLIHVSADNRYKLYVNGEMVCYGPSRGDILKWRFESLDIADQLKPGLNTLCAIVWNFADFRPVPHFSVKTGLIVQGNGKQERVLNTNGSWEVMQDEAYDFHAIRHLRAYYVVGPGEAFDGRKHPWQWLNPNKDDNDWLKAKVQEKGYMEQGIKGTGGLQPRILFPRQIPLMEMKEQNFAALRRVSGLNDADAVLEANDSLTIAPNSKVTILLDQGQLTTAYPVVRLSGGQGSELKLTYAESLYHTKDQVAKRQDVDGDNKGNRNEVANKAIRGNYDIIIADGGSQRRIEPLWWRTFRYVQVEISTQSEALILHQINSIFTGYPLEEKARFKSDDPLTTDIWKVGWHSQRMCAGENFYDCPYYEQLQYVGDTRIQGLVTYYVSGDTALWKKSISSFYDSRLPFGLTQSRYPSYKPQIIPTFSLVWITMCHDYLMHCDDADFIKPMLPAMMDVLQWFEERLDENGLPGDMPYWHFVDWVRHENWRIGVPPQDKSGHSAVIALQYVYTLERAALIYEHYQQSELAIHCRLLAEKTKQAVLDTCWDADKAMVADTPAKKNFSQHANIWAVLVNLRPESQQQKLMQRILTDPTIAQCTYYFRFYLAEALKQANMANQYTELLGPWDDMLKLGLSTFAEKPDPTRSDCHAWSASPCYHFLSLICGIEPDAPGFKRVRIKPALGTLTAVDAQMPHPQGDIAVILEKNSRGKLEGQIKLPPGLKGVLELPSGKVTLNPGNNLIGKLN